MLNIKIQGNTIRFYSGDQCILTIEEEETQEGILLKMKGALVMDTGNAIHDELKAIVLIGDKAIVDFGEATSVSSEVLKNLLHIQEFTARRGKGRLILRNVSDSLYGQLEEMKIAELLMIEE